MANQFGLDRHIPADIARTVRQNSKFGCVHCRNAIYQYEHIAPTFEEARTHDPEAICLLCGGCHDKVTRGLLSKGTIANDYLRTRSDTVPPPFDTFDLQAHQLTLELGTNRFVQPKVIFEIDNQAILQLEPPEAGERFPKLSGKFFDNAGQPLFSIQENVWEGPLDRWDVEIRGRDIFVRCAPGQILLHLRVNPPSTIAVKRLDMRLGTCHVQVDDDLVIGRNSEAGVYAIGVGNFSAGAPAICVRVDSRVPPQPCQRVDIIGGQGLDLVGTGVSLAIGAAQMTIANLKVWAASE